MKTMMNTITKIILLLTAFFLTIACSSDDETTTPPDPSTAFVGNYETKAYQLHLSGAYNLNLNVDGGTDIEIEDSPYNPEEIVIENLEDLMHKSFKTLQTHLGFPVGFSVMTNGDVVGKISNNKFSIPETSFILSGGNIYYIPTFKGEGTLDEGNIFLEFEYRISDMGITLLFEGEVEMEKQ